MAHKKRIGLTDGRACIPEHSSPTHSLSRSEIKASFDFSRLIAALTDGRACIPEHSSPTRSLSRSEIKASFDFSRLIAALAIMVLLLSASGLRAQSISHIETTKNWYYIYDQNGKKIKTLSASQGELKGYSSTFYIIKQGTYYITYDASGKRLHMFGTTSVGEILGVAGDTFTSRIGSWIYTWNKNGKKISTRAAKQ